LVGRSLSCVLITRALADSGGALVCGPTGVGVSALLAAGARQGRDGNRTIRCAVIGNSQSAAVLGLDNGTVDAPGIPANVLVLDDAHLLDTDEAAHVMQRVLDGLRTGLLGAGIIAVLVGSVAASDAGPAQAMATRVFSTSASSGAPGDQVTVSGTGYTAVAVTANPAFTG
jgi:hypothetical protein